MSYLAALIALLMLLIAPRTKILPDTDDPSIRLIRPIATIVPDTDDPSRR